MNALCKTILYILVICGSEATTSQIRYRTYSKYTNYDPEVSSLVEALTEPLIMKEAMDIVTCSGACATEDTTHSFKFIKSTKECVCIGGPLFIDDKAPGSHPDEVIYFSGEIVAMKKKILLVRQREDHYFDGCSLDCNPDDPENGAYSIASTTEDHRLSNGLFFFELCYEFHFGDDCFQFEQKNNPFTTTTRESFKLFHSPVSNPLLFEGLAQDSPDQCLTDGQVGGSWNFAVGSFQKLFDNRKIPGPMISSEAYEAKHVLLFVWTA